MPIHARKRKANLRNALAANHARNEAKVRAEAAEQAAKAKATSVARGIPNKMQRKGNEKSMGRLSSRCNVHKAEEDGKHDNMKPKETLPFQPDDTVLLVGEGNFSFAHSLLDPPHRIPPSQLLATTFDSEQECYAKYPDARGIVEQLRARAKRDSVVVFNIDAGALSAHNAIKTIGKGPRWSKIYFGFPHVGAGHKDETRNVLSNQLLLLRFLVSAAPLLTRGPPPDYVSKAQTRKRRRSKGSEEEASADEEEERLSTLEEKEIQSSSHPDMLDQEHISISHSQPPESPLRPPLRSGSVLITLRNAPPYTLWDVSMLAKRLCSVLPGIVRAAPPLPKGMHAPRLEQAAFALCCGAGLVSDDCSNTSQLVTKVIQSGIASYALWRSFEFVPSLFRGYTHRRTVGWIEGISTSANEDIMRRSTNINKVTNYHEKEDHNNLRKSRAAGGETRTWEFGIDVQKGMDSEGRRKKRRK